jgi:transcriptional regulator with XRE-family HTH domain
MTTGSIENDPIARSAADAAPELAVTVREIIEEARRVAGSGTRLAERLQELGIRPADTTRYSESAISNWIRGRTMPPADVLVAASLIAGLPLVTPRSAAAGEHGRQVLELGADLQAQVDALRAAIIDLYGRLGYPLPNLDSSHDSDQTDRPAASTG